jgi:hypothetical protein
LRPTLRGSDAGIRALKVGYDPLFRARKQNDLKRNTLQYLTT